MTLMQALGFDALTSADLRTWGIVTATDWTAGLAQTGKFRVSLIQLADGRYFCNADLLTEENGYYADALAALPPADVKGVPLSVCRALLTPIDDPEFGNRWPEWEQILGAGLGPQGAEDGWPVGARVQKDGFVWMSRTPSNVNTPLMGITSTWSRDDGTYVVPAGWQYQIGEQVTEDGVNWFEALEATSFSPTDYPAGWLSLNAPATEEWVQPTGAQDAYAAGATVTHNGQTWTNTHGDGNVWEPGVFGWTEAP